MSTGKDPGRGVMLLILGIVSILCCAFVGPVAWVMAAGDLKKINAGQISQDAKGLTTAGMVLGIIGTILIAINLLWLFAFGGMAMLSAGAK